MRVTTHLLVAAATLAVAGCGGGDSDDGVAGTGAASSTRLAIEIRPEGPGGPSAQWTLSCDPAGGTHPDPTGACRKLDETGTDVFAEPPDDVACTDIYGGPELARVDGTLDGERVSAQFTRTDGCQIERWDRAAFLLPRDDGT